MKSLLAACLLASLCKNVCAAPPEFDGVMASQGTIYFALREEPEVAIRWKKIGDRTGSYLVKAYDKEHETLSLSRDQELVAVKLKVGKTRPAPSPGKSGPTIELLNALIAKGDVSHQMILTALTAIRDQRDTTARKLAEAEARATKEPESKRTEMLKEFRRRLELEEANLEFYTDQTIAHWAEESRTAK